MLRAYGKVILLNIIFILLFGQAVHPQVKDISLYPEVPPLKLYHTGKSYHPEEELKKTASTLPLAVGVLSILYLFNPVFLYENDKVSGGITKELSVGFGGLGEYRTALEYTYLFRKNQSSHFRLSAKYDYLLSDIEPSNMLQTSMVASFGGGVYYDLDGFGFFPEASYGFSIRNHKLLFYPHVKARYTIMAREQKSNSFDISFGIILGIANPFIDLKIRRRY